MVRFSTTLTDPAWLSEIANAAANGNVLKRDQTAFHTGELGRSAWLFTRHAASDEVANDSVQDVTVRPVLQKISERFELLQQSAPAVPR